MLGQQKSSSRALFKEGGEAAPLLLPPISPWRRWHWRRQASDRNPDGCRRPSCVVWRDSDREGRGRLLKSLFHVRGFHLPDLHLSRNIPRALLFFKIEGIVDARRQHGGPVGLQDLITFDSLGRLLSQMHSDNRTAINVQEAHFWRSWGAGLYACSSFWYDEGLKKAASGKEQCKGGQQTRSGTVARISCFSPRLSLGSLGASLQILLLAFIKSASCKAPYSHHIGFRQLPSNQVTCQA